MTVFLAILATALAAALALTHFRHSRQVARLAAALRSQNAAESPEAKVSWREQLLNQLVDGLSDPVIVFDEQLEIRLANPSAARLFGWTSPPVGRPAAECIRDADFLRLVEGSVRDGRGTSAEIVIRDAGRAAGRHTFEVDVAPLLNTATDTVSRVRAVLHDITEARKLEQVRKDFVANASHELRTPLTIINGYLENLLGGGMEDRDVAARFLGVMKKHGDRIARIIEDMLTISKLESESDAVQRERFDLRECATEVVGRLQPIVDGRKAKVKMDFPADSHVAGDPFYWDQILFNLVENALKENEAPGLRISLALETEGAHWVVRVADNGVGIPKAALDFIFKRFYRVDPNRSAEKKGTGLGLSIVKRAVEAHGGTIEVSSTPGTKTEFTIRIPHQATPPD